METVLAKKSMTTCHDQLQLVNLKRCLQYECAGWANQRDWMSLDAWRWHETQSKWPNDKLWMNYYGMLLQCGKNAGQTIIHCGQVQIIFGQTMQFSDRENHGEHEMPALKHQHAKLNKITGVNLPRRTPPRSTANSRSGELTPPPIGKKYI